MSFVELKNFENSWYKPGGAFPKRALWMLIGQPLFATAWLPSSSWRVSILRLFGAHIGRGVVIKPHVKVKYPWHLLVGDHCWIGEECWIDNLTTVRLDNNVCVSQGAYFCTGNHDWSDAQFGLQVFPISLGEGAWAGAKCLLTPGASLGRYAIAAAGAVIHGSVPDFEIYSGNPAVYVRTRRFKGQSSMSREAVTK